MAFLTVHPSMSSNETDAIRNSKEGKTRDMVRGNCVLFVAIRNCFSEVFAYHILWELSMAQVYVMMGQCRQEMRLNVVVRRSSGSNTRRDLERLWQKAVSACMSGGFAPPWSTIRKRSGSGPEKCSTVHHPPLFQKYPRLEHEHS
jgi:hypothetical protein